MKPKSSSIIAFLMLSGLQVLAAQDQPLRPRGEVSKPGFLRALNLSDQQTKEIDKLRVDMMKQAIAHQAKISTSRVELHELFRADQPERGLIEKKMNDLTQLENQRRMARLNHWFAVNKLLNPDQQKVWKRSLMMRRAGGGMADRGPRHRPFGRGR